MLKQREGVIYKPVWDRTNYAVGIGHNGPDVIPTKTYTDAEISALFKKDSAWCTKAANKFPNIQTQSQFDALFSLCYNCGGGIASRGSDIYDMMSRNEHVSNKGAFMAKWQRYRWNSGQLRSRRNSEISQFYNQAVPNNQTFSPTAQNNAAAGNDVYGSGSAGRPGGGAANAVDAETIQNTSMKGLDPNMFKNKGTVYPLIRINDHVFTAEEIVEFYIETGYFKNYHEYKTLKIPRTGFVPTVHLVISTAAPDLLKGNQIKSGDKMAVFLSPGGGMVKSYRGDYLITSCVSSEKPTELINQPMTFIINGELFVPSLHSELEKNVIQGSSRDAMMEIANLLGLGFYFCDPDDTDDYQGWSCQSSLYDYALEVSSHAWKEFDAFYECWIDPRYGLSFINMNKMLIVDGLDEPLDIVPYVSTIINSVGIDGQKIDRPEEEKKENTSPQAKMLTNIVHENEAATPFYVKKWNIVNRAGEIANEIGVNSKQNYNLDNPGVQTENTGIDMSYSIPINQTKLQNGFFVLMGPGVNLTYTQAD